MAGVRGRCTEENISTWGIEREEWRKFHKEELRDLYASLNIIWRNKA
jgi:hypothetical protein